MTHQFCVDITALNREVTIDVFGPIGNQFALEESADAGKFVKALRDMGRSVSRLTININSPGGSVWDALAMYGAIRDFPGEKIARVDGVSGSAASFLMLAADRVLVSSESAVFIHEAEAAQAGRQHAMQNAANLLGKANKMILDIYERRTGADRELLASMMAEETWFIGAEAKEAGFADEVLSDAPKRRIAACLTEGFTPSWRNPPAKVAALIKPKPAPLNPEVAARLEKLRAFN